MFEAVVYFIMLIGFSFYDIRAMAKAKLIREMISYLALVLAAGTVGLVFFLNPYGYSISHLLMNLFHVR